MTATRSRKRRLAGGVVPLVLVLALLGTPTPSLAGGEGKRAAARGYRAELAQVRKANGPFRRLDRAFTAGYRLLRDKDGIECIEEAGEGAMGIHYVNGELVGDSKIDSLNPEAVIYEPTRRGRLRLVAVEYVVFQGAWDAANDAPPELFGRTFKLVEAGNRYGLDPFYELHAWLWKHNPAGVFADNNPRVNCPN